MEKLILCAQLFPTIYQNDVRYKVYYPFQWGWMGSALLSNGAIANWLLLLLTTTILAYFNRQYQIYKSIYAYICSICILCIFVPVSANVLLVQFQLYIYIRRVVLLLYISIDIWPLVLVLVHILNIPYCYVGYYYI